MLHFVTEIHAKGLPIIHEATTAREIIKFFTIGEGNLKNIEGWSKQIMHCTGLSLRYKTSIYQRLLADFEQNELNLQHDAIEQKLKYVFNQIGRGIGFL